MNTKNDNQINKITLITKQTNDNTSSYLSLRRWSTNAKERRCVCSYDNDSTVQKKGGEKKLILP